MSPPKHRRLPPAVVALLTQVVATVLAYATCRAGGWAPDLLNFAVATGALAAAISWFFGPARQAPWWLPIHLAFLPGLVLSQRIDVPSYVPAALFATLLLVYWSTFRTQVPLYLSSRLVRNAVETLLPPGVFTFLDVGSGLGGVQAQLSGRRPEGTFHGVEAAPLPFLWSWVRLRTRANCRVRWGSLWACDFGQYDVVFAYLSPVPMTELFEKARREMRPGSLFISNTFAVPECPPDRQLTVDDLHHSTLHVWTMPTRQG